jgi:hypothetical protein
VDQILDGGVAHETVRFGLDGHLYEIDLSSKNATKLRKDMASFVEHGIRVSARSLAAGRRGRAGGGAASQADENRHIREWAQSEGYDVADRGRIRQDIVLAYRQAH